MKNILLSMISCGVLVTPVAAAVTLNPSIGNLRDANGVPLVDGSSAWAMIVRNDSSSFLPGGLTDGGLIGTASQITGDFDDETITIGDKGSYTIVSVGTIDGSEGLLGTGGNGVMLSPIVFSLGGEITTGKLWGLYWFPNKLPGDTLTGAYEVGGFAQSAFNAASGGDIGMLIPADGTVNAVNFLETNFNQNILGGADTGLGASRFTAVAVPEPSSLALALFGFAILIRRRRK